MSYGCFRLDMKVIDDKERLRDLLTHIIREQAELQDRIAELHARFESMEADLRYLLDKSGLSNR